MTEEVKKPRRRRRTKKDPVEAPVVAETKVEEVVEEKVEEVVEEAPAPASPTPPEPVAAPSFPEAGSIVKPKNQDPAEPSYGLTQTRFGRGKHLWRRRTRRRNVE